MATRGLLLLRLKTTWSKCSASQTAKYSMASHEHSIPLYEAFCAQLSEAIGKQVATGEFGADMKVELLNDGPVTICIDTKNKE